GAWADVWSRVDLVGESRNLVPEWARLLARPALRRIARLGLHALPHYGVFRCGDGRFLSVGIVTEGHFWRQLCEALDMPRFASWSVPARTVAGPLVRARIARALRRRSQAEWTERLCHLPVTPVLTPAEARDRRGNPAASTPADKAG
ncbi:MAG: CoA transferase, partial [Myxococcota bacterium]